MGCGCGKNKAKPVVMSQKTVVKSANYDAANTSSTKVISNGVAGQTSDTQCFRRLHELEVLESKVIELFNHYKDTDKYDVKYVDYQKRIREWMGELWHECPNAEELLSVSNSINADYSAMFRVNK